MLINNINITTYKALLLSKEIQSADVVVYDDWLRNALNPLYIGKKETYKQINVELAIQQLDDESCLKTISSLIKSLTKCTLKFDEISLYYDCTIGSKSHERVDKNMYILTVQMKCGNAYEANVTETMNQIMTKNINVAGDLPTSAIVTITSIIDTVSATLSGFSKTPIVISNLHANTPIIIDGEKCTVTETDMDTTLTAVTGAGKWNFRKYNMASFANPDDTDIHIAPTYAHIPVGASYSQSLVTDGAELAKNLGYDYLGHLRTGLNVATGKTINFQFYHDDGCSIYVNGVLKYSHDYHADQDNGAASVSLVLATGWNVIEILWIQHYGPDGIWNIIPTIGSQVTSLNCFYSKGAGAGIVNKFADADLWAFPSLQPGTNILGINISTVDMQVSYKPKFI